MRYRGRSVQRVLVNVSHNLMLVRGPLVDRTDANSYENVRTLYFDHLASMLSGKDEESAKVLCDKIDEKIDRYANGDLDHAVDVITLVWKFSKAGGHEPKLCSFAFLVSSLTSLFSRN